MDWFENAAIPPTLRHLRPSTVLRLAMAEHDGVIPADWGTFGIASLAALDSGTTFARFREAQAREARGAVRRLRRMMEIPALAELEPGRMKFGCNAAEMMLSAQVKGGADEIFIDVSLGLLMALDDAILTAASQGAFLIPAGAADGQLDAPIPYLRATHTDANRFVEYDLVRRGILQSGTVSPVLPIAAWRLLQCDVLSELALQWIVLHEHAHWALGHLALVAKRHGRDHETLTLNEARHTFALEGTLPELSVLTQEEQCAIEIEADALATDTLLFYHEHHADQPLTPWLSYSARMNELVRPHGTVLANPDHHDRQRLVSTAIGIVVLLLEAHRRQLGVADSATHPTPDCRAFGVLHRAFSVALHDFAEARGDELILRTTDEDTLTAIAQAIRHQVKPFAIDMEMVAHGLGVRQLFVLADIATVIPRDPDHRVPGAVLQDLLLILLDRVEQEGDLSTLGAKEYWRLRQVGTRIRREATPWSRWTYPL